MAKPPPIGEGGITKMQNKENQLNLNLSDKEKSFCLKDINKKIIRCLYVYEQEQKCIQNYDYKTYLDSVILYVHSSNQLFDGILMNVIVNLNILRENNFNKEQFKKIIFECKNYIDFFFHIFRIFF